MKQYAKVALIIFLLLALIRVLNRTGITSKLATHSKQALSYLGIPEEASILTIIVLILGIGYGGGLVLQEAKSGRLTGKKLFHTLTFLSLCHGLVEETILMALLGGSWYILLFGRILISLAICLIFVQAHPKIKRSFWYLQSHYRSLGLWATLQKKYPKLFL